MRERGASATASRRRVAVVTDSTTYLPHELIERWGIRAGSLYVGWERRSASRARVHGPRRLLRAAAASRRSCRRPRSRRSATSWPATEPLARRRARRASRSTSPAGCRAPARARAKRRGSSPRRGTRERWRCSTARPAPAGSAAWCCSPPSVAERGEHAGGRSSPASQRARETLDIWFCLDTLEYLRRGGRIGAAQAMVGTALKVKPILTSAPRSPRSAACARTGARSSGWSPTCTSCTTAARATGSSSTPRRPADAEQLVAAGREHVRLRAAVLHRGRPGARRAPRLGHARRRDDARGTAELERRAHVARSPGRLFSDPGQDRLGVRQHRPVREAHGRECLRAGREEQLLA